MRNSGIFPGILASMPLSLMFLALGLTLASCENVANNSPKPKTYTITFNANDGTGAVPEPKTVNAGSFTSLPGGSALSKTGYTFSGWNTKADGTGTNYGAGASYTPESDVTLYAKWDAVTYTVTFHANGGNGTPPSAQSAQAGSSITLPSGSGLTKAGYNFSGWNINASGTGLLFDAGIPYTPSGNITLYAKWSDASLNVVTYTIRFNANGGNGTPPAALTINAGSSITFPNVGGLTKTNALFGGWKTDDSGDVTIYQPGDSYTPTGSITFYTVWISAYTVTFDANGGSGTQPTAQTVQAGSGITLPDESGLTKTGYTLSGWYKEAALINQWDFDAATVTGNITLYAQWNPIIYYIAYNANGGTGTIANSSHTYDVDNKLSTNTFTRAGYTFIGWAKTTGGAVELTDGQSIKNLSDSAGGTITLYAQWNPITYTVIYDKTDVDADGTIANSSHTYDVEQALNANAFTRTGYKFAGWTRTAGGAVEFSNGQSVKNLTATDGVTVKLYAVWLDSSTIWTVSFETNGGSPHIGDVFVLRNTPAIRPAPDPDRTGYTFVNWFYNSELTAQYNFSSIVFSDITLYAKWSPIIYSIVYHANGGTSGTMTNSSHTYDVDKNINVNTFTRTGYTFTGWAMTAGGAAELTDGQSVINLTAVAGETITLYAKWNPITYYIEYNANGGTGGTMTNSSHTYDVNKNLNANAFTRAGYNFAGWARTTGGAVEYTDDQSVKNLSAVAEGMVTLYAKWNSTVTFNANGATSGTAPALQKVNAGSSITLPGVGDLIKTGYTFGGWNTNSAGTGSNYSASYTPTGNITLYAKWLPNTAGITLDVKQIEDGAPIINAITISRSGANGNPVTFPVMVSNASDYANIAWEVAGVGIYAGQTVTGSGVTFTLNAAEVKYNSLGGHALILTVTKGGMRYQKVMPFTIVQ